ncbi:MAG: NADH-quinone oxidoreductase subunit J [Acidimicrobiales bacterium]
METVVFIVAAAIILLSALGVVLSANPVHAALSLVATLFGVAVLFIAQDAQFLAAVQVIVYAGAIVVLFLFVIMLLGVDQVESLRTEPLGGQRPLAVAVSGGVVALTLVALFAAADRITGAPSVTGAPDPNSPNVNQLARVLFTDFVYAFEITALLLTIAVVGAVVMARRLPPRADDAEGAPD